VVLFFARGPASGEGKDLKALELPDYQSDAISALAARNPHVVVIVMSASAVDMTPWVDHVAGILMAWYPGQAGGDAIADIVSGRCSPSGKLSFTMARMLDDYACHSLGAWDLQPHFPDPPTVAPHKKEERHPIHGYDSNYAEGLLVGYRWFDAKAVEPLFPFGFGLSYTTFKLSGGHLEIIDSSKDSPEILAMVDVCNTGECRGAETVQVYVEDCSASVQRPVRELKGFEKVFLYPGETKTVSIPLDFRSFAFWDDSTHCWMIEPGEFLVHQGTSSRDFSCSLPVVLGKR
jgi:beta-glucosidase